jgi:exodeoxyribonuclease VII small subunit
MTKTTITQNLSKLEAIVEWFGGDKIDVEQACAKYEQAAQLASEIKAQLETTKNQIVLIDKKFDE